MTIKVGGPGRCTECSFYVALQGHRDGCSTTAPITPGEADFGKPPTSNFIAVLEGWKRSRNPKPKTKPRNYTGPRKAAVNGATVYGLKALRDECETLAGTHEGARNDQCNKSFFNIGQLVGSGDLPDELADEELSAAARLTGLPEHEINSCRRSGFEAGKAEPRRNV